MRGHEYAFHLPREQARLVYRRSVPRNDFRRDEHGRLVNDGPGRERVEQLTRRHEEVSRFQERSPHVRDAGAETRPGAGSHEPGEMISKVYRPPLEEQRMAPATTPKGNFQPRNKF